MTDLMQSKDQNKPVKGNTVRRYCTDILLLVRFQVVAGASMKFGVLWGVVPRRASIALMMEAARTSETSVTPMRLHGATSHRTELQTVTCCIVSNSPLCW
jgi:hypothetical protein